MVPVGGIRWYVLVVLGGTCWWYSLGVLQSIVHHYISRICSYNMVRVGGIRWYVLVVLGGKIFL